MGVSVEALWKMSEVELLSAYYDSRPHFVEKRSARVNAIPSDDLRGHSDETGAVPKVGLNFKFGPTWFGGE
jgi:hypothetical protein